MSFYINNTNQNRPGPINGSGMNGICEKILIETTKVFDACRCTTTEPGLLLPVTGFSPANPTLPLTYVSAETTVGVDPTVSDLVIDRLDTCPNYANVSFSVEIPITVTYRDANGVLGTATTTVTVTKSVVLFVPQPALSPVNVNVNALFSSRIGTFVSPDTFSVTGCIQIIVKVTSQVDVLVPSYGYPCLPPCQAMPTQTCPGLQDLPIYPTATMPGEAPRIQTTTPVV